VFHEAGRRRWTPILVALGLVLVASGVAAAVSLLQSPKQTAQPNQTPAPGIVSVTALRSPPPNQPLLWFRDDSTNLPFVLRATDWTGRTLGQLAVSCRECGILASPDGQRLLIGSQSSAGLPASSPLADRVFSSSGKLLSTLDGYQAQWSDDSRHMCAVRNRAGDSVDRKADLKLMDTNTGKARQVASVLTTQDRQLTGAWTLLSCSTSADRAVLVFTHDAVRALRELQLSTGSVLLKRDVDGGVQCGCPVASLAVSGDGTTAAENASQGSVMDLDLLTGEEKPAPVAWTGRGPVIGLSWSGNLAVTPVGVYSFPSGTALWQAPLPAYMVPLAVRPHSDDVLLSVWQSSGTSGQAVVVRASGTVTRIPGAQLTQPPLLPF